MMLLPEWKRSAWRQYMAPAAWLVLVLGMPAAGSRAQSYEDPNAIHQRAISLFKQGYSARSIPEFEKAIAAAQRAWGPRSVGVYRFKVNLAYACVNESQYDRAEPLFHEAFDGLLAAYKSGNGQVTVKDVGTAANNYANYWHNVGQYAQAMEYLKLALAYYESDGWNGPASMVHDNLGTICRMMKDYDGALAWYEKAIKFRMKQFGASDPRVAVVLNNVATVYFDQKRFAESAQLLRRSLKINQTARGPDGDPMGLVNLAFALENLGQFEEAESLFKQHVRLAETVFDEPNHQSAARAYQWMARISATQHRWNDAVEFMERNRRMLLPIVLKLAGGLSEAEQRSIIGAYTGPMDDALSIGWARRDDPAVVERSATWLMNAKGLLYQAMAERSLLARDARLLGQAALVEELQIVRGQLSTALNQVGGGANAGERQKLLQQIQSLVKREADLSRKLGFAGGRDRANWNWTESSAVRQRLAADAVFVDVARVKVQDYNAPVGPEGLPITEHYLAWLIPPAGAGNVQLLDLGTAEAIDPLVAEVVSNLEVVGRLDLTSAGKLPELEEKYRAAAARLAERILHPLIALAKDARHWILSPDADLWLIPYSALPLADGSYFTEHFQLTHVVSGRDVLGRPAAGKHLAGPPLIVADPNYDLGVTESQRRRSVSRLVNTAEEARLAAPLLEQICGSAATVYLQDQARKSLVLSARSPQVLMLGTHGTFSFLRPDARQNGLGSPLEDPLLRCQLLFAGCNGQPAPQKDNGVLLGMEVLGCDLRGTDLVVLSACETGRGDVHNGQAAAGMRQAFQLAGAHDVVATLWSVDDEAATRLTSGFLTRLAASRDKAESLRTAQCELMSLLKKQHGTAHPFYWAPYTLTGCEPCVKRPAK